MEQNTNENKGTFKSDLLRTFKELKESRAEGVAEDVETVYRRKIEDLCRKIRDYDRNRENIILELSPSSAFSNKVAPSDFNAAEFLAKDMEIGLSKRDAVIRLEIVIERYETLFGPIADRTAISKVLPGYKFKYGE